MSEKTGQVAAVCALVCRSETGDVRAIDRDVDVGGGVGVRLRKWWVGEEERRRRLVVLSFGVWFGLALHCEQWAARNAQVF